MNLPTPFPDPRPRLLGLPTRLLAALLALAGPAAAQSPPSAVPPSASSAASASPSPVIGQVGGRAVRADQLSGKTPQARARRLGALFVQPALQAYLETHRAEWAPAPADVDRFLKVQRERVRCGAIEPDTIPPEQEREFAQIMTAQLKLQRFIHQRHGGGRILFQQTGYEAYDATRRLLLELEQRGAFRIDDAALREQALGYWLKDPASGLMPDPGAMAFTPEQSLNPCPTR